MIVLICGGSGSGKSTLATKFHGAILSTDSFYVGKSRMTPDAEGRYDFDNPSAVALQECREAALALTRGEAAEIPDYDMIMSERVGTKSVEPHQSGIVVIEGIFALHSPMREIGDLRIFIDTPIDLRVSRRIRRDAERGRSEIETLRHAIHVEAAYEKLIEPMKAYANVVLGREGW
jgi:uridine kinase